MLTLRRNLESIAHNSSNGTTNGFKKELNMIDRVIHKGSSFPIKAPSYYDFTQGGVIKTDNPLNIALLKPNAFLAVQTAAGVRYTRNGNLQINNSGTLIDINGMEIMNANGINITVPTNTHDISFRADGSIYSDGRILNRLGIFRFQNLQPLQKEGYGLWNPHNSEAQLIIHDRIVAQGALENSNTNTVQEALHLVNAERDFAMASKVQKKIMDVNETLVKTLKSE